MVKAIKLFMLVSFCLFSLNTFADSNCQSDDTVIIYEVKGFSNEVEN